MPTSIDTQQDSRFEVRAENLSAHELETWTVLSDAEKLVVRKLIGPGAKLVSGPRGSGKSTLLRLAYFSLLKSKAALPVYVNFSKALALEPLFHSHADAVRLFRLWVIAKIVDGVGVTFSELGDTPPESLADALTESRAYIARLETGTPPDASQFQLSPSGLKTLLSELAEHVGGSRTVLLLDDAAHAFSVRQQREFFEVYRELRSRDISAKAAIYPGVTSFSPSFQVGHEAELIEVWFRPDTETYLEGIRQIAARRFPELEARLGNNYPDVVNTLGLAAFGLPRGFVNMVGEMTDLMELNVPIRKAALEAISTQAESVLAVFQNIADKLPRFSNYVNLGKRFFSKSVVAIRHFNKSKEPKKKSATISLLEPFADELERTLRFMEYAGLTRRIGGLYKGEKGQYRRYSVHYACFIEANGLALGSNYRLADIVASLRRPLAHSLVKSKAESLLGLNYARDCTLALPPCSKCGAPRISDDQKFCMGCGNELRAASIYAELLRAPIDLLPIPARKKLALKESNILTVQQILSDESQRFRRPGTSIGPIWARRILTIAEEYTSV